MSKISAKTHDSFHLTEMAAQGAPVDDIQWHGKDIEANTRLEDPGQGRPIILRQFKFEISPDVTQIPTKKQLADHHLPRIKDFLWKDELELIEDLKVVKNHKRSFIVFAICQPKKGSLISWQDTDKLKPLQDVLSPGNKV